MFVSLLLLCGMSAAAQSVCGPGVCDVRMLEGEMRVNRELYGDNYTAYQSPSGVLTPAPAGYEACYMSHYGRHGSRYLIGKNVYEHPYEVLKEADEKGMLTPLGCQLLGQLDTIRRDARGHTDELTLRGAQQHQQIAERMYRNFPEIFSGNKKIDARSTPVVRCILSMANETMMLKGLNPQLEIAMDASEADKYYLNYNDEQLRKERRPKGSAADSALTVFEKRHYDPQRLMNSLFREESYWREAVRDPWKFAAVDIWKVVADMQSTELRHRMPMNEYFTDDELYNIWLIKNAGWYVSHGPSPLNGGRQVFFQRNLIRNIINTADSCLALLAADPAGALGTSLRSKVSQVPSGDALLGKEPQGTVAEGREMRDEGGCAVRRPLAASLRFGHEVVVMPTVCFLNLNGYGEQYADLEDLAANGWHDNRIFPMGSNIQMVFYRSPLPASPEGDETGKTGVSGKSGKTGKSGVSGKSGKTGEPAKPILVKILLNEEEAVMPQLTPVEGCYYKWQDVKDYCLKKLATFSE